MAAHYPMPRRAVELDDLDDLDEDVVDDDGNDEE